MSSSESSFPFPAPPSLEGSKAAAERRKTRIATGSSARFLKTAVPNSVHVSAAIFANADVLRSESGKAATASLKEASKSRKNLCSVFF